MMVGTLGALLQVERGRPTAPEDALFSILVEALAMELGTKVAAMNAAFAAALFGDGGDASVVLQIGSTLKAFALRTHSCQEPRSQNGAGSRQAGEEPLILVFFE